MFSKIKELIKSIKMSAYSMLLGYKFNAHKVYFASFPFLSKKNKIFFRGKNIYIGHDCHIGANVTFENNILLGSKVSFVGGDHRWSTVGLLMMDSGRDSIKMIYINNDVWIGHGAIIMHGVTVGEGAVVASGSVVTKDVPEYSIVGGNPARFIRARFTDDEKHTHKLMLRNK